MRNRHTLALLVAAALSHNNPAHAQGVPTFDASAVAAALQQVQNGMLQLQSLQQQLQQATALVNAVKGGRGMDVIASLLNQPGVRDMFPSELVDLLQGSSEIAAAAQSLRQNITISSYPGNDFYLSELSARGDRISRDMATAQQLYSSLSKRSKGLDELRQRLGSVSDPAEVDQLNARINVETSMATADLSKLQLLAMQQQTQDKIDQQRAAEAAQKANEAGYDYLTKGITSAPTN
jgi:type IV secretion system protein VirB5